MDKGDIRISNFLTDAPMPIYNTHYAAMHRREFRVIEKSAITTLDRHSQSSYLLYDLVLFNFHPKDDQ